MRRDELEAVIGCEVIYDGDDQTRVEEDHCLCSVNIPETMVEAGYWVHLSDGTNLDVGYIAKK